MLTAKHDSIMTHFAMKVFEVFLILLLAAGALAWHQEQDRVLLRAVEVLTFAGGKYTTARRVSPSEDFCCCFFLCEFFRAATSLQLAADFDFSDVENCKIYWFSYLGHLWVLQSPLTGLY